MGNKGPADDKRTEPKLDGVQIYLRIPSDMAGNDNVKELFQEVKNDMAKDGVKKYLK